MQVLTALDFKFCVLLSSSIQTVPDPCGCGPVMARELTQGLDLLELGCHGNVELVTKDETFSCPLPLKTVSGFVTLNR